MNRVLGLNQLVLEGLNADFDGDSINCVKIDSEEALSEFNKMELENNFKYEHTDSYIVSFKHECVYSAYKLSKTPLNSNIIKNAKLEDIKVTFKELNDINAPCYEIDGEVYTYVTICINKILDFNMVYKGHILDKKGLKRLFKLIEDNSASKKDFLDKIYKLQLFFLECATYVQRCVLSFNLDDFIITKNDSKKDIIDEPVIAFHQIEFLLKKLLKSLENNSINSVYDMYISGSRVNHTQFKRAFVAIGHPSNAFNRVESSVIDSSLLDGLSKKEYFIASDGSKKAIVDKERSVPRSGAYQRKMMINYGMLKLSGNEDCGTTRLLTVNVKDNRILQSLIGKYYLKDDALVEIKGDESYLIGKNIQMRSVILCEEPEYKICNKCWGHKQLPSGKNIGINMSSYLSERFTQKSMQSHHVSGAANILLNDDLYNMIKDGELWTEKPRIVITDNIEKLKSIMLNYYSDIEFKHIDANRYELVTSEILKNEDVGAILNRLIRNISKNAEPENAIPVEELFISTLSEILDAGIMYSSYIELLISMLYYDENNTILRYSNVSMQDGIIDPVYKQVSMDNVLNMVNPKLVLFYDLNKEYIKNIYSNTKNKNQCEHSLEYVFNISQ